MDTGEWVIVGAIIGTWLVIGLGCMAFLWLGEPP
jgi:hypothetical protein